MTGLVASLPFVPFKQWCTCHPRSALFRHQSRSSRAKRCLLVRDSHDSSTLSATQSHATPATESATATSQATEGEDPSHTGASPQQQADSANQLDHGSTQGAAASAAAPLNKQAEVLNPMNYPGTSNKARRKALVQYLSTIPEADMSPEMLRRWRISKANRGKTAWNFGRRHPPGTSCVMLYTIQTLVSGSCTLPLDCFDQPCCCRDHCKDHSAYQGSHDAP